ncbi:hypothetical protein [Methylobacterium haplocladii]|uniref:Uncharacterized protein n=1 Tax=Methylobacterium haplocladii TaxID=1176176 RepID=A0A512ILW8_9HYPH|nr:hypothetical protein [Methylobacterium haplocladii]GEO98713.1 hypothetical protein MHA02_11010 [Methylobacterium haplocladii]GJD85800.1 hypothetical protein HPGCJGGD_3693 [Methylobacterium haplocladii]GLS57637.1 hypothetical protein GCM10007887_02930 [Methylobacterium haplocladii]
MAESHRPRSPTQELIARVLRIVRASPDAASEMLELMFLVSQIEALTTIDREYRDARRVISRLRNPLWDMGPSDREHLLKAAETIRKACNLKEKDIPVTPLADLGERERIERHLIAALGSELDAAQIARVTGAVAAALQH